VRAELAFFFDFVGVDEFSAFSAYSQTPEANYPITEQARPSWKGGEARETDDATGYDPGGDVDVRGIMRWLLRVVLG
jgi:hypothetical protein